MSLGYVCVLFFFFKQKTAYEMRISDWSSDVCSSDLVLTELKAEQLFHKIRQRPGKPFWFGKHRDNTLIFAFPGNPVSTFMCFCRYFIPWLEASLGIEIGRASCRERVCQSV